ncbi:MAG: hypothetical protein K1X79_02895 [Oligoflexia bacterium]|nr:hypothetical protein [Oligoflexia bacterium]
MMLRYLALFCLPLQLCVAKLAVAQDDAQNCARPPQFATQRGIKRSFVSTSERFRTGIVLFPVSDDGKTGEAIQLPSWTTVGRLGPFVTRENGDIIVGPVPNVNTLQNPPERQTYLYRIRSNDGQLEEFTRLPADKIPSQNNPYGVLGLAYDCKLKLVYATSVAGSTADKENGSVFAIRADDGKIISEVKGVDALGIGISHESTGAFAYIGSARSAQVLRIGLTPEGLFASQKAEAVLRFDPFDSLRARKIRFVAGRMVISTTEFYYNLVAQTEFEQPTLTYIQTASGWANEH